MEFLPEAYISKAMSAEAYETLVQQMAKSGKSTGPNPSEAFIQYTRLNATRMRRIKKTWKPMPQLEETIREVHPSLFWITLTESWCGDAAIFVPMFNTLTQLNSRIVPLYLLRDQHLELMDHFLTKGGRSIPKLMVVDAISFRVYGAWGPRTQAAQTFRNQLQERGWTGGALSEVLQRWYLEDKGHSFQEEFRQFLVDTVPGLSNLSTHV